MDMASISMMIGIIVYTRIYRRRGRIEDIGFFRLCVICIVMSVADLITYVLDGSTVPHAAMTSLICNDIFFIAFELFCGGAAVYLDCRNISKKVGPIMVRDADRSIRMRTLIIMIPAIITSILILCNHFGGYLYYVDPETNMYYKGSLDFIIYIAPTLYAVAGTVYVIILDVTVLWLYILLIAARLVMGHYLRGISATGIMFAVGLAFIHTHIMEDPFFEDGWRGAGIKEGEK